MIKTGITGGETPIAGELVRILINHPDVVITWIESEPLAGRRVDNEYHGLIGELEMSFTQQGDEDEVDLVFSCDGKPTARQGLLTVDLTQRHVIERDDEPWIYGLPEMNRKRLVHDQSHVACPGALAYTIALALIPLARNLMLGGTITARCKVARHLAAQDPVTELQQVMSQLQLSFNGSFDINVEPSDNERECVAVVTLENNIELELIHQLYDSYYDDHNLTHRAMRPVDMRDAEGTAKCLLYITRNQDGKLEVTSVADAVIKGSAGVAVHNMNLLCGLHERVGLTLKATDISFEESASK